MPTVRGWLVIAAGVALFVAGNLFGARALEQLGTGFAGLSLIAVAVVRLGRHDLDVTRRLTPERVRPGQEVDLSVALTNRGVGSAPLLLVEDRLPAGLTGAARLAIRGIEPEGRRLATFSLRATRRGRYEIGPLDVSVVDPFGLAQLRSSRAGRASFLVHPRVEVLSAPRDQGDHRSAATSTMRQPTGARGEDFYTLREYVEGDDLRKIHWASTAKRGRYMIRQEETPWQTRATVLLDDRAGAHDGFGDYSSFERSVEAAASVVDLYHRLGYGYRLTCSLEEGLHSGRGSDHWNAALDLLATIHPGRAVDPAEGLIARLMQIEASTAAEAALVVITGDLSGPDAVALTRCARRFRQTTVVLFPAHRFSGQTTKSRWQGEGHVVEVTRLVGRSGANTVVLGPDDSLAAGWAGLAQTRQREAMWGRRPELV